MVVRLDAGRDVIRAYVSEQAALGLTHVRALVNGEGHAILALTRDISEDEGTRKPNADDMSMLNVLQHLNSSFERSTDRLATLASGRQWVLTGAPTVPGGISGDVAKTFAEAREQFEAGTAKVLAVLEASDGETGLELTANHTGFGDFNWLEWAVYSHHVHAHDHVGQLGELRDFLGK